MFVNNDDDYTTQRDVTLNMSISGATQMRFSNDGTTWSAWEDYADTCSWSLAEGHSLRHVYGQFKSADGVVVEKHDGIIIYVEEKIVASDGVGGERFSGYASNGNPSCIASSYDGSVIFVGASQANSNQGKVYAYVYNESVWNEYIIDPPGVDEAKNFGFSVACSSNGQIVAIAALGDPSVSIFQWDGNSFVYDQKFKPAGVMPNDFGVCVSMSDDGNKIAAGSYKYNTTGGVFYYSYDGSTWDETIITNTESENGDFFGFSTDLSADGNTMIVGAPYKHASGDAADEDKGTVYLYQKTDTDWTSQSFTPGDLSAYDGFGRMVSISSDGSVFLAGMRSSFRFSSNPGYAYIYRNTGSGWEQAKLVSNDTTSDDWFGFAVSLSSDGQKALVGSYGLESDRGHAYLFSYNGVDYDQLKISASEGVSGDAFGFNLAISGDGGTLVIGSPWDDIGTNTDQGSVLVY